MENSPFESSFVQQLLARRRFGVKPGLDVTRAIMAELGDPQKSLRFVHVAGTNGKGAVCALLDSILRAAGLRVCRYTSPHLVSVAERFFVDGAPAPDDVLAAAADAYSRAVAHAVLAATGRDGAPAYLDVFPSARRPS